MKYILIILIFSFTAQAMQRVPKLNRFNCKQNFADCLRCKAQFYAARESIYDIGHFYLFKQTRNEVADRQRTIIKQTECCDKYKLRLYKHFIDNCE